MDEFEQAASLQPDHKTYQNKMWVLFITRAVDKIALARAGFKARGTQSKNSV